MTIILYVLCNSQMIGRSHRTSHVWLVPPADGKSEGVYSGTRSLLWFNSLIHHKTLELKLNYSNLLCSYISVSSNAFSKRIEQGKSVGFDGCDRPSNLTRIEFKSSICQTLWPWDLMDDLERQVKIGDFFVPCDLEIEWMTLKNKRTPLLCCSKLCASFHSRQWIQTGVAVRKYPIWVTIDDILSCVTLEFERWPWKTIGHLFYASSSFVYHFVAIGEFKLKFKSGNAQFGSKPRIFLAVWPWDLSDDLEKQ